MYFKSDKEFLDNTRIHIDVEGNSDPKIIEMISFPQQSRINKSLEFLFNNKNIKSMMRFEQTEEIKSKITQLSIEYNILTCHTAIIGERQKTQDEIDRLNQILIPITVKTSDGKNYSFKINPFDSVGNLKKLIEIHTGINKNCQHLDFESKSLNYDYKSIQEYGIQKDSVISQFEGRMQIFGIYVNGRIISLKVEPIDKIIDVKQQIQNIFGTPNDIPRLKLMFAGKELEYESRLQDYSISNNSKIYIIQLLRGCCSQVDILLRTFSTTNCDVLISIIIEQ